MEDYERELKEVETLRKIISRCNVIPPKCRAVQAALKALDGEAKRIVRDEKLRKKFSIPNGNSNNGCASTSKCSNDEDEPMSDEYHKVQKEENEESKNGRGRGPNVPSGDDLLMEWQDVQPPPRLLDDDSLANDQENQVFLVEEVSDLGRSLSDASVRSIASANIEIVSPLSAIALAIHGALVSDYLQFGCTGIPDTGKKSGFAAPIRQLPKGKFLPDKWDAHASSRVALRYRKEGCGAAVLLVTLEQGGGEVGTRNEIQVYFGPSGDQREATPQLRFSLDKHFNLDSLEKALSSSGSTNGGVSPSLHYKSLSILLTEFAKRVDLGNNYDNNSNNNVGASYQPPNMTPLISCPAGNYMPPQEAPKHDSFLKEGNIIVEENLLAHSIPMRGDFEMDLNPLLVRGPSLPPHSMPGNLMGPNHPSFQGDFREPQDGPFPGLPLPGGLGMQPRFDSYYPPGVTGPGVTGPGRGRGRMGRGRRHPTGGDPNPDLLRPPSDLGDNMFM